MAHVTPLRRRLWEIGKFQHEMAAALGVTEGYISRVAAGRQRFSEPLAEKAANFLGVSPVELASMTEAGRKVC